MKKPQPSPRTFHASHLLWSVIGVQGVSNENASAKQSEKCHRNHRTHPYATLHACLDHRGLQKVRRFLDDYVASQKWFHAGDQAHNLKRQAHSCASVAARAQCEAEKVRHGSHVTLFSL